MQAIWSLEVCEPEATSFLGFLSPYFNSWKPGVSVTSPTQASALFHSPPKILDENNSIPDYLSRKIFLFHSFYYLIIQIVILDPLGWLDLQRPNPLSLPPFQFIYCPKPNGNSRESKVGGLSLARGPRTLGREALWGFSGRQ